ncbi:MAG TPA: hypothetical protein VMS43_16535 [Allosphingosinicella sp.]|nr:hypothetical protein [Allosphingosinicella sp.]
MKDYLSLRLPILSAGLLLSGCVYEYSGTREYVLTNQAGLETSNQTGAAAVAPDNFFWDSGEQQCQLDRRKIVYHFWLEPANGGEGHPPGALWLLRYDLSYEYRTRPGGRWTQAAGLEGLDYHIVYQGGQKPPEQGEDTRVGGNQRRSTHTLLWGYDYTPIESVTLIVKANGAIQKTWTWPNATGGNECENQ